jgi:transcriptional regulator with XRE-family HTH domain
MAIDSVDERGGVDLHLGQVSWLQFGRQLRRLRIGADLTQEKLADACGVASRSIGNYERGKSAPRAETVNLLVTALAGADGNAEALRRIARRIRLAEAMKAS